MTVAGQVLLHHAGNFDTDGCFGAPSFARSMHFQNFAGIRNVLGGVCWLLVLTGCAYDSPAVPLSSFDQLPAFSDSGDAVSPEPWWQVFGDPRLDDQIEVAVGNNFSLAAARYRIYAAEALARREASDLLPDLNGLLSVGSEMGPGDNRNPVALGLDVAYPVDLWGQIDARVNAEWLRADATSESYQAIGLILSSEIARTWFSLIEANAQLELLAEQIKTNRTGLELQESRFGLGLVRSADVLRQRQLLESTLEQEVVAEARVEVLEHQLAVLLGDIPQLVSYDPGSRLPDLPPLPATGLPAELVQRRPDIRRAYLQLQAADQDLAAAVSDQYPRLNLTGSLLNLSENPDTLLRDWFLSLGGQLIAPLLDGGQRKAEVDRAQAERLQRFSEYGQVVLVAFQEVEDALAREKYQLKRIQRLEEQVKLAGQSSVQLRGLYQTDDAEYLDVLSAITGQQSLQRQLLSARLELVLIRVSLYLALAGEFDPTEADRSE